MTEKKDIPENAVMLITEEILRDMINNDNSNKAIDILKKLKEIKDSSPNQDRLNSITTQSSFLRAIWMAEPESTMANLQKIIDVCDIIPSFADLRNEDKVRDEIINLTKYLDTEEK